MRGTSEGYCEHLIHLLLRENGGEQNLRRSREGHNVPRESRRRLSHLVSKGLRLHDSMSSSGKVATCLEEVDFQQLDAEGAPDTKKFAFYTSELGADSSPGRRSLA